MIRADGGRSCLTADTARKLAFLGIVVNLIMVVVPGVGTLSLFQRFQSLLNMLSLDASLSAIIVVVLFAAYVAIGMIVPIIALQRTQPGHWYAVPLILLAGGAVTVLSLGGVLLLVAGALLIWAGPDEAYWLPKPPEAGLAEALEDQMSQPRPANEDQLFAVDWASLGSPGRSFGQSSTHQASTLSRERLKSRKEGRNPEQSLPRA
jgi:hypothetical protein